MPRIDQTLQSIDEVSKKRLYKLSKAAVAEQFMNPAFDEKQSTSDLHQFNVEMERVLKRYPEAERGMAKDNLLLALKDYAPARVDFTFKGREAFPAVYEAIETVNAITRDQSLSSDMIGAADALIDRIIQNTLEKMPIAGRSSPASHSH